MNLVRKTLFLLTGSLVFISFLLMALFTYNSSQELVSPELITQLNLIPMVCVILAYTGYGLGYGVIPSLIAAELMPVEIRYCVQQLQPFLQYIAQIYCGWSTHDTRNDINIPTIKTEAGTHAQLGYTRSLHYVCRYLFHIIRILLKIVLFV